LVGLMHPTCNQAHLIPQNDSAGQQGSVLDAIAPSAASERGREGGASLRASGSAVAVVGDGLGAFRFVGGIDGRGSGVGGRESAG
jgi:hypothetical protein